jgi:hypothetical protein
VTRPIVVDPTPFLIGAPIPPTPYETGWKDTVRANGNQVLRVVARWAPQEVPAGGVAPGQNLFPIDPTSPRTNHTYVWHCHVLGHEDNDMMRKLAIVSAWTPATTYQIGRVIAHDNVNYRARTNHHSQATQPPNTRFDLWERVNDNDGTWQPQIIYAVGDRVLHEGLLYAALRVHQATPGQPPPVSPELWHALPNTACGQLATFCHGASSAVATSCDQLGHAGDEAACGRELATCLAACTGSAHDHGPATPCSGLCNDPVSFSVPDGTTFRSPALGSGAACYETTSELLSGSCSMVAPNRQLTVNGQPMSCNAGGWGYSLPTQRHHGYCIQTTAGGSPVASFSVY